jgi:hypothetical protein
MTTFKYISIALMRLLLMQAVYGQQSNPVSQLNESRKTVGLIDSEYVYTAKQIAFFDSLLFSFNKRSSIRVVVIASDSSKRDKIFKTLRSAWGYTDTEITNDIPIVMTMQGRCSIGFYADWIYTKVNEETIFNMVKKEWFPEVKKNQYFEALQNLLYRLLSELECK